VPAHHRPQPVADVDRHWEGFTGGPVWAEITSYFESLRQGARPVDRNGAAVRPDPVTSA
jgi:hypothetical protein